MNIFHERKLDALEDLIEAANGRPVLVAYWFKHDLRRISERLSNLGIDYQQLDSNAIGVTYRVNILAVRHSFRTVRCIVRNISLYIQRTELMRQSVAMVPSGSVREGSS